MSYTPYTEPVHEVINSTPTEENTEEMYVPPCNDDLINALIGLGVLSAEEDHSILISPLQYSADIVDSHGKKIANITLDPKNTDGFKNVTLTHWQYHSKALRYSKARYTKTITIQNTLSDFITKPDEMGYQFHKEKYKFFETVTEWAQSELFLIV